MSVNLNRLKAPCNVQLRNGNIVKVHSTDDRMGAGYKLLLVDLGHTISNGLTQWGYKINGELNLGREEYREYDVIRIIGQEFTTKRKTNKYLLVNGVV